MKAAATTQETGEDPDNSRGTGAPSVAIRTHGCKLNQADSQVMARRVQEAGFRVVNSAAEADVVVLNSCTVTATADAKARQFLRGAARANSEALVVATGCYAQRAPTELEGVDAVSLVLGNTQKSGLVDAVTAALKPQQRTLVAPTPIHSAIQHGAARSRAMVKIQEGCDQVCAYCIVPKVRGRERSIPPEEIINQINRYSAEGYREAVLTGTQLGTYGFDIPGTSLLGLVRRVLEETPIERLRVSSLQPQEITTELLELWSDARLCPHFHIPLQSGSNTVLKAMRRRYDTSRYAQTVDLVRTAVPDAGITTDIIIGFPGEGPAEYGESYDFAESVGFSDLHVFPYSPREGTSAAYFKEAVPEGEKRARTGRMLALAADAHQQFRRSQLGKTASVLWETPRRDGSNPGGDTIWSGLTANYLRVRTSANRDLTNAITNATLAALEDGWVTALVD